MTPPDPKVTIFDLWLTQPSGYLDFTNYETYSGAEQAVLRTAFETGYATGYLVAHGERHEPPSQQKDRG